MNKARIIGTGACLPDRVVTSEEIAAKVGVTADWILQRTGIVTRRFVEPGVGPADLAERASRDAIAAAGLSPSDIDLIIFATFTPDYQAPGCSWLLQHKLGAPAGVATFDVRAQCNGFITGLSIAQQFIATGKYRHVLLVGAEVQSAILDFSERGTGVAILFGDGAGAVVLGKSDDPERGIVDTFMHSDGSEIESLCMKAPRTKSVPYLTHEMIDRGEHYLHMSGKRVFAVALQRFPEALEEALARCGYKAEDVDLFVPHQANLRIIEAVGKRIGLPPGKVFTNVERIGNTSAASIPIALHEALGEGRIAPGNLVALAAFGGGFAWGSALIRW